MLRCDEEPHRCNRDFDIDRVWKVLRIVAIDVDVRTACLVSLMRSIVVELSLCRHHDVRVGNRLALGYFTDLHVSLRGRCGELKHFKAIGVVEQEDCTGALRPT